MSFERLQQTNNDLDENDEERKSSSKYTEPQLEEQKFNNWHNDSDAYKDCMDNS